MYCMLAEYFYLHIHVVEPHCYAVDIGELFLSKYIAESITTDCRAFVPVGLSQLRAKLLRIGSRSVLPVLHIIAVACFLM